MLCCYSFHLQHLAKIGCFGHSLRVLQPKAPRAFHTGTCGVHQTTKECAPTERVATIELFLTEADASSIDNNPLKVLSFQKVFGTQKPNGGWGDVRDHALCTLVATTA